MPGWTKEAREKAVKALEAKRATGWVNSASTGKHWKTNKTAWNAKDPVVRQCSRPGCGSIISTPPSLTRVRFCSTSCQARTTNRKRPDGVPGDVYGEDWPQVRQGILARDRYTCRLVNLHDGKRAAKRIEVHHLCYDAACRDETHLVTLCSRCHQGGHRRQAWPVALGLKR
jgi:5-methylcytosine-specific restriction endonuclease McrA